MRIALLGYGKMGKQVEAMAQAMGHKTSVDSIKGCTLAIDFSHPEAVLGHVERCMKAGVGLVVGTTGWYDQLQQVKACVEAHDGALVYGANFSVGIHLFKKVLERACALVTEEMGYEPALIEAHHKHKVDAPSGTALELKKIMEAAGHLVPVSPMRYGFEVGLHEAIFDSSHDTITLTHRSRNRDGYVKGALMAASWLADKKGIYGFDQIFSSLGKACSPLSPESFAPMQDL